MGFTGVILPLSVESLQYITLLATFYNWLLVPLCSKFMASTKNAGKPSQASSEKGKEDVKTPINHLRNGSFLCKIPKPSQTISYCIYGQNSSIIPKAKFRGFRKSLLNHPFYRVIQPFPCHMEGKCNPVIPSFPSREFQRCQAEMLLSTRVFCRRIFT